MICHQQRTVQTIRWTSNLYFAATRSRFVCIVSVFCVCIGSVLPSPQRPTKIAQTAAEILYIEDGFSDHRSYKLEDFFWTGSGDGAPDSPWDDNQASTIYKTKTIMSTVYISVSNENQINNTETQSTTECTIDCETVSTPVGEIKPTPTFNNHTLLPPIIINNGTTDRHFWLLTVIKTDGKEPIVAVLEKRLAKIYSVAFRRQQERHLGIAKRQKRDSVNNNKFPVENKPVNVCIHTLEKNRESNEIEVLYHVLVSGKPVAAITAASDMRYVSDEEVATELGFPVKTKAEPYLKIDHPQSLARARDTWLFIGVALATIFLLLMMVTIFTFCLNKRKRNMLPVRPTGIVNRQHIFDRESGGHINAGYIENQGDTTKSYQSGRRHKKSPLHPRNTISNETLTSRYPEGRRPLSSPSSVASSTSSDGSPLMLMSKQKPSTTRKKYRASEKRLPFAVNKAVIQKQTSALVVDTDSSSSSSTDKSGSQITLVKHADERGRTSPKSYLSMPSVKSFPRSSIPEILNKVLEPVSVMHLDMTDDVNPEQSPIYRPISDGKKLLRHGSMGSEDPGVIGPVVWDLHCKRLQNESDDASNIPKHENHANRMRKRFNELLDDTFSLFGASKDGPDQQEGYATGSSSARNIEPRGHSAVVKPSNDSTINGAASKPRPKTSDPRRIAPSPGLEAPRGAWASTTPSPLIRPLSAGPFHRPTIDMERILADGTLPSTDPAVPLIAAIKTELEKCSLPGSTTNLANK